MDERRFVISDEVGLLLEGIVAELRPET